MSKSGDYFYVKTYGDTHAIVNSGGERAPNKHGQRWMVYWRKFHVATFNTEVEAREDCAKRNADKQKYVAELRKAHGIDLSNEMVRYSIREEIGELLKMATEIRVRAERIEGMCKRLLK